MSEKTNRSDSWVLAFSFGSWGLNFNAKKMITQAKVARKTARIFLVFTFPIVFFFRASSNHLVMAKPILPHDCQFVEAISPALRQSG